MKILLDENIDVRFKSLFSGTSHEVYAVRDMKWNGIKNGALLHLLKNNHFDCWIVADKNIPYQQDINNLPCIIIVLNVFRNTLDRTKLLFPDVLIVLEKTTEKKVVVITER